MPALVGHVGGQELIEKLLKSFNELGSSPSFLQRETPLMPIVGVRCFCSNDRRPLFIDVCRAFII
jgi:hypothetical protein